MFDIQYSEHRASQVQQYVRGLTSPSTGLCKRSIYEVWSCLRVLGLNYVFSGFVQREQGCTILLLSISKLFV